LALQPRLVPDSSESLASIIGVPTDLPDADTSFISEPRSTLGTRNCLSNMSSRSEEYYWRCAHCTQANTIADQVCAVCEIPNPKLPFSGASMSMVSRATAPAIPPEPIGGVGAAVCPPAAAAATGTGGHGAGGRGSGAGGRGAGGGGDGGVGAGGGAGASGGGGAGAGAGGAAGVVNARGNAAAAAPGQAPQVYIDGQGPLPPAIQDDVNLHDDLVIANLNLRSQQALQYLPVPPPQQPPAQGNQQSVPTRIMELIKLKTAVENSQEFAHHVPCIVAKINALFLDFVNQAE
jgi:hypothetical protein